MTKAIELPIERIREQAASTVRAAIEASTPDRELVTRAFNTQLAALKLPPRPVIFYPNLNAAAARVRELTSKISEGDAARAAAWDAAWAAAWDAAPKGAPPLTEYDIAARSFLDILRGGGFAYWVATDAVHIVLAQIRTVQRAENVGRLHCENAPAIQYGDGSGLYYWKGIQVPEELIKNPEKIQVHHILHQRNAEVRRAMIERYGVDRFVLDANAVPIDQWRDNYLLGITLPDDPDGSLVALKLRCPSTSAVYIIRVPPNQRTVRGALAWSFGLDRAEDYTLQQES